MFLTRSFGSIAQTSLRQQGVGVTLPPSGAASFQEPLGVAPWETPPEVRGSVHLIFPNHCLAYSKASATHQGELQFAQVAPQAGPV